MGFRIHKRKGILLNTLRSLLGHSKGYILRAAACPGYPCNGRHVVAPQLAGAPGSHVRRRDSDYPRGWTSRGGAGVGGQETGSQPR